MQRFRNKPVRSAPALEAMEGRILLAGFSAAYYDNADLTTPVLLRIDQAIDFNWGTSSPAAAIQPSTFSARWTGQIKPAYSETYTFTATADDGVRELHELTMRTGAGSNCGSCLPLAAEILAATHATRELPLRILQAA